MFFSLKKIVEKKRIKKIVNSFGVKTKNSERKCE